MELGLNPLLKPRLYKAGLMTSDARVVERKKPGKVKARKSPTWGETLEILYQARYLGGDFEWIFVQRRFQNVVQTY